MPRLVKVYRTRLCPGCGTIQRIGYNCEVCGHPIPTEPEPNFCIPCQGCGDMAPAGKRCPWCGWIPGAT